VLLHNAHVKERIAEQQQQQQQENIQPQEMTNSSNKRVGDDMVFTDEFLPPQKRLKLDWATSIAMTSWTKFSFAKNRNIVEPLQQQQQQPQQQQQNYYHHPMTNCTTFRSLTPMKRMELFRSFREWFVPRDTRSWREVNNVPIVLSNGTTIPVFTFQVIQENGHPVLGVTVYQEGGQVVSHRAFMELNKTGSTIVRRRSSNVHDGVVDSSMLDALRNDTIVVFREESAFRRTVVAGHTDLSHTLCVYEDEPLWMNFK